MKRTVSFFAVGLLITLAVIFTSCENRGNRTAGGANTSGMRSENAGWSSENYLRMIDSLKNYSYDQKDDYKDQANKILDRFEDRLNDWKSGRDTKQQPTVARAANDVESKIQAARDQVKQITDATATNWNTVRSTADHSIEEVRSSFHGAGIDLSRATNEREGTEDSALSRNKRP